MHVVFVSACRKNARLRTCRVLDSYAVRTGDATWMTPITAQGLEEVGKLLRRTATRQTAVACFRNDGRSRMRLLWVVGNKSHFDRNGASPVATRQGRREAQLPDWASECALLAAAAGVTHDLGKFGHAFQAKLASAKPVADPVRHEWISLFIVRRLLDGEKWDAAWQAFAQQPPTQRWKNLRPFDAQLSSAGDALLYLVATHHKLPGMRANVINHSKHVRDPEHVPVPVAAPSASNMAQIAKLLHKIRVTPPRTPLYWRAAASFARMALILADHAVSAESVQEMPAAAYANTDRTSGRLNQPLDWHLDHVGRRAAQVVAQVLALVPPALSSETVARICAPVAAGSRFFWQEKAYRALYDSRQADGCPHLVLNVAGTGSGKTRMNARAACAVGNIEGNGVRFATALNLRTLTLQTGDAYSQQLEIPKDEMSCVIGDTLTLALHAYQKSLMQSVASTARSRDDAVIDDDENPPEQDYEASGAFEYHNAPDWLAHFLNTKPGMGAVIGSPVLVSTIDFLIAAGEPHRQANHALAALRVMTSDLILDEIDGYDPKALIAVLRVIMMSAFYGRSVIASSATLSMPVARLVWQAYSHGAAMRGELTGAAHAFKTAFIGNTTEPQVARFDTIDAFMASYDHYVQKMLACLAGQAYRVPVLLRVPELSEATWLAAIRSGVETLHAAHAQHVPSTDARVSFGLVRIANIHVAVKVAQYLSTQLPNARIVCYHAQHFPIQRFHIEQRLDYLLSRAEGDGHLWRDPEIVNAVALNRANQCKETIFVVVATPVEEIGRDHDFDWAVIEPSSTQSIVQTAGRVNRHRLVRVEAPNVAILQYNYRAIRQDAHVFDKPGLEAGDSHPVHDMARLLDWENGIGQIDARVRFERRHRFAAFDDVALERQTERLFRNAMGVSNGGYHWMAQQTYTDAPLRDAHDARVELTLTDAQVRNQFDVTEEDSDSSASSRYLKTVVDPVPNTWLVKPDAELESMAHACGIARDRALTVSTRGPFLDAMKNEPTVARHMSFGFYRTATR